MNVWRSTLNFTKEHRQSSRVSEATTLPRSLMLLYVYAVYRPCCGYDTDLYVPSHRYGLNPPKRIPECRARLLPYHIRVGLNFKQLIYMNMNRKVKAKWGGAVSRHVTNAYGGSRSITPLIPNIDARRGEWSLPAPVTLLQVPSEREDGCAPEPVWTLTRTERSLAAARNRSTIPRLSSPWPSHYPD